MTEESGRGSGTGSGRCSAHGERNGERKALTPEQALEIFRRRCDSKAHSTLLAETAEEFGVTQTSIRHIWGRQTWKSTTMPLWTQEERASSRSDSLCQQCLNGGRTDIEQACPACPINRKRGRPVGTKDSAAPHVSFGCVAVSWGWRRGGAATGWGWWRGGVARTEREFMPPLGHNKDAGQLGL